MFLIGFLYADSIKNYKVIKKQIISKEQYYLAIREYKKSQKDYYLAVNINTLETKIIDKKITKDVKSIKDSTLNRVYKVSKIDKNSLTNAGINSAYKKHKDIYYITIDLCPSSKKGYEKRLFESLNKRENSIAIALSAKWAMRHQREFKEILEYKNIDITWINHTYNHYYYPRKKLKNNFLLAKWTDLYKEIIANEKFMLSHSLVPSVFIRFPGLVSDAKLVDKVVDSYSLVPLGSDTWIAKAQKIKDSSIILLHGNLNEKKGIKMFLKEYNKRELNFVKLTEMFKQ
jgi:peptidoglycan/xylan/chitin deacetylase (PgdA/CDA1 family)